MNGLRGKLGIMALVVAVLLAAAGTIAPVQAEDDLTAASASQQGGCAYDWFFGPVAKAVEDCPTGEPTSTMMARLEFERGEMVWNSAQNTIYVLYRDFQAPYWESFPDTYMQGMPERQAGLQGPLGLWQQPRRGFGELWRTNTAVRARLGWALEEWEDSYMGWLQQAETAEGTQVFFMRDDSKVYQLNPGANGIWELFSFLG
jgi:hypothetical protein